MLAQAALSVAGYGAASTKSLQHVSSHQMPFARLPSSPQFLVALSVSHFLFPVLFSLVKVG
jgi:hypothetical protein